MDTADAPEITFDENGVCKYCHGYEQMIQEYPQTEESREKKLRESMDMIKASKKGKYDCIMGLSGGVDSSYLALMAKQNGLNPLLVHFDNGWNSELAVNNIENIIKYTGFDLFTYVVDWEEYRDLQLSYIKASVIDWEVPTDHGFYSCLFAQAYKHKIKYILAGFNYSTEGIMQENIFWNKRDLKNLKGIHKKHGTIKLKTYPTYSFSKMLFYQRYLKYEIVTPLNYIDYNYNKAKEIIIKEFNWRDYGGKHYESIFTRFYQGYILIEKFGFDKRKAHYSTLVNSGQLTREEAIEMIAKPSYDADQLIEDKEFFLKKMRLSKEEFDEMMKQPKVDHAVFGSYETSTQLYFEKFFKVIQPMVKVVKKVTGR